MSLPNLEFDFSGLFSLSGAVAFAAGVISTRLYYYVKDSRHNRGCPERERVQTRWKTVTMAWVLIAIAIAYSFSENYKAVEASRQNAAATEQLSRETKSCSEQFNAALKRRSQINVENDNLSVAQRDLLTKEVEAHIDWLAHILDPPASIASLELNDPVRQRYSYEETRKYYVELIDIRGQIRRIQDRQGELERQRQANPYPDPSCGK